jgi:serine/threonine protein kinase
MLDETAQRAAQEIRVGEMFAGHSIEGVLGRGGMGVVYRATDMRLNRATALKVIAPALSADGDFRRRFQRESQLAASVRHPHVVPIFQAGESDGLLFVTMELIEGVDLRTLIGTRTRLDPRTACEIVTQVAGALDAAHASGLVHRDVKPANILLRDGAPLHGYLTDFGLTKRTSSQSGITKSGLFVGTVDYAAPEQIKGRAVDARADVYALGCVLFEMLAGEPPFRRDNEYATIYAHTSVPPPDLDGFVPGLPQALKDVVTRALEKEPEDRFPSAGDLGRAASAAAVGRVPTGPERTVAVGRAAPPPPAPPSTPPPAPEPTPEHAWTPPPHDRQTAVLPPARGNPWIPALVVILALLLVAGGATAAIVLTRSDSKGATASAAPTASAPQQTVTARVTTPAPAPSSGGGAAQPEPTQPAATPPRPAQTSGWSAQIGFFTTRASASKTVQQARAQGISPKLLDSDLYTEDPPAPDGGWMVSAGLYSTRSEAKSAAERSGFSGAFPRYVARK